MKADQLFKFVRAGALALALTFAFVPSVSNVVLGQESEPAAAVATATSRLPTRP